MSDIEATDESEGMAALRKQLKTVTEERDRYRTAVQHQTIRDAGLDPELGIVKRLAKDYEGEWTKDAFADFAKAEGLTIVPVVPEQQRGAPTPVAELSEADQARLASQSRVDALGAVSAPDEKPSLREQINEAESKGDWPTAMALKSQLMNEIAGR